MQNFKSIIILFLCFSMNGYAQLSTKEKPVSFDREKDLTVNFESAVPIAVMPQLDMVKIEKDDQEDENNNGLYHFGYQHKVNYDLTNSGTWYELPNGDKLWKLNVICPGALSVNFCYDKFWIPEGGKFFVYSKDKKHTIGAFTSRNNKGDRINIRGFATGLVYGSDVVLEYYQPKDVSSDAIISIDYIIHGYRFISNGMKLFGDAGSCMVNINCEEGQNWQYEKKAVARIIIKGNAFATGSLINTTNLSQTPFFLTANHCVEKYGSGAYNTNLDSIVFYWNYETPGCVNDSIEPLSDSTSGATIVANDIYSDFALLRLTEDPKNLPNFNPFYLGWDCSGQSGSPGVCIHHPKGDVKKISVVAAQPLSTHKNSYTPASDGTFWKVTWGTGAMNPGSSGAPLFNAGHKVIGQLQGGYSNCGDSITESDWFGKFSDSWTGGGINSIYKRLNCWLDSLNTGVSAMEGLLLIRTTDTANADQQLYGNIIITSTGQFTIQSDIELMGNSRIIVQAGGKLIIDGGTLSNADLDLKTGATLQIINGGIIETRNDFYAPVGAIVNISQGEIIQQ